MSSFSSTAARLFRFERFRSRPLRGCHRTHLGVLIPVSKFPDPMQPEALRLDKGTQSWSTFDCLQWDGIRHRLQRLARELNPKKKPDHRTQAGPVAGYAASRAVEVEELTVQFRASLARGTNCAS